MARKFRQGAEAQQHRIGALYKTIFLFFISVLLLLLEPRIEGLGLIRKGVNYLLAPAYVTVDWVAKQQSSLSKFWTSNTQQISTIVQLESDNILLNEELWHLRQVQQENAELRKLWSYKQTHFNNTSIKVSRIIGGKVNSHIKELIFDLGQLDGVKDGMVVTSYEGLVGQVITVGISSSRALAITDARHSVPIMVQRSRDRFILDGTGADNILEATDLHTYINVKEGDILLTSGLGGRFPAGIPVAKVVAITDKERVSLRDLRAQPLAQPRVVELVMVREGVSYKEWENE